MRYRLMATYRGVPYEVGLGPSNAEIVLFAACPPPEELGFEPATGHWRKPVIRAEIDALWESRPVGTYRGEPCIVLDDPGDRLHIAYLGTDAERATSLGYWQVDRGVFELLTPREEVHGLTEERVEKPLRWGGQADATGPIASYPYGSAPWPVAAPPTTGPLDATDPAWAAPDAGVPLAPSSADDPLAGPSAEGPLPGPPWPDTQPADPAATAAPLADASPASASPAGLQGTGTPLADAVLADMQSARAARTGAPPASVSPGGAPAAAVPPGAEAPLTDEAPMANAPLAEAPAAGAPSAGAPQASTPAVNVLPATAPAAPGLPKRVPAASTTPAAAPLTDTSLAAAPPAEAPAAAVPMAS